MIRQSTIAKGIIPNEKKARAILTSRQKTWSNLSQTHTSWNSRGHLLKFFFAHSSGEHQQRSRRKVQLVCQKKSGVGTFCCNSCKKLGGLLDLKENSAKLVIKQCCQVILARTPLCVVEHNRRGSPRGPPPSQVQWAMMNHH